MVTETPLQRRKFDSLRHVYFGCHIQYSVGVCHRCQKPILLSTLNV